MMIGVVRSNEARIRLTVKGRGGSEQEIEAVVDTGYSGSLTLPIALIAELDLRWLSVDRATLADGSTCFFQVHEGKVVWDGKLRRIAVDAADADPLIGMWLLRGHELKVDVRYRGKVTIKRKLKKHPSN